MQKLMQVAETLKNKCGKIRTFFRPDDSINGAVLLPIRITVIYLFFSVLVYMFGPFEWITYKPFLFYYLLIAYIVALWLGYRVGLVEKFPKEIKVNKAKIDNYMCVLSILVVVNYGVYLINIFRDYGMKTMDFPNLLRQMAIGIKDPGLGYILRWERLTTLQGSDVLGGYVVSLFNYVWSFFRYPILVMSMLKFKKLNVVGKVFSILYLVTMYFYYLSIGTTIDVLHMFLLAVLPVTLNTFSSWYRGELTKRKILKLVSCVMVGVFFVLSYFTWMMISRGGINDYDQPGYNVGGVGMSQTSVMPEEQPNITVPDTSLGFEVSKLSETTQSPNMSLLTSTVEEAESAEPSTSQNEEKTSAWSKLSAILKKFWVSFSAYFTQGYYGMSQAMTVSWTPMFGVGNSMFLVDFLSEHVYDIDQFTYQMKIEEAYGWGSDVQWHSMYTWLANDVSFLGVIFVMFFIGMLFAMMFKDAVKNQNIFAQLSVFYFILMMVFIPCNNQIAQRPDTLFSFILIVICWFLSKRPPKFLRGYIEKLIG